MSKEASPEFVTTDEVEGLLSYKEVIDAFEELLRSGQSTQYTPLRTRTEMPNGHLLYMPSQAGDFVGIKLASVSPGNVERGLPRIQGLMILSDATTLCPRAIFDARAFTVIRTAALSALAVRHLARWDSSQLVVFGSGPQAWGHVEAIKSVRPVRKVIVVGRSSDSAQDLVSRIRQAGLDAEIGDEQAVAQADVVACCTSATNPLFDSALLRDHTTVVAIGSHSPEAREVDTALIERAEVTVESKASAFAEAGDILLACQDGVSKGRAVDAEISEVVTSPPPFANRPRLFKGVGEAWADVVTATLAARKLGLIG